MAEYRDAMKRLAYKAYNSGGRYYNGNQTHYLPAYNNTKRVFFLSLLLDDQSRSADCQDMSLWWETLCHAVGLGPEVRRIDGMDGDQPDLHTKWIKPVGQDEIPGGVTWTFHHVGSDNDGVFDPCIEYWGGVPYAIRVPQDEVLATYKSCLFANGTWIPKQPFWLGGTDSYWQMPTGVD